MVVCIWIIVLVLSGMVFAGVHPLYSRVTGIIHPICVGYGVVDTLYSQSRYSKSAIIHGIIQVTVGRPYIGRLYFLIKI